jgi:hypothetical protein
MARFGKRAGVRVAHERPYCQIWPYAAGSLAINISPSFH